MDSKIYENNGWFPFEIKKKIFFLLWQQIWDIYAFGLVSLSHGILTFVGYLMPKPSLLKNSSGTI